MRFVLGFVLGLLVLPVLGFVYFRFGYAPVATAAPPMMFERQMAHMALNARIEKEAQPKAPFEPSESDYVDGAHTYREQCAVCHGGTVKGERTAIAKGMFPKPPELLVGTGVTDDPAGETFWKVQNGIRLTGMPAYSQSLSDRQMWQVSLLLANANKLPETAMAVLKQPLATQ